VTTTATPFSFHAGTKRVLNLTVYDGDDETPNTPLDLAGMTVRFALSRYSVTGEYSTDAAVSKGAAILNAGAGTCRVELLGADTAALRPGKYRMEWEVEDEDGETDIVAVGDVTLLPNIEN